MATSGEVGHDRGSGRLRDEIVESAMASRPPPPLVVVTPIYEDAEAASRLFADLAAHLGTGVFIVAVDDGSVRHPVDSESIGRLGLRGAVLRLKRNLGHQRAIAVGLGYVAKQMPDADRVVVMDSDGEDSPLTIPQLIDALAPESVDIVVATRKSRVETLRFRAFYFIYRGLFQILAGRSIAFGNFMAL